MTPPDPALAPTLAPTLAPVLAHIDAHREPFLARLVEYLRHPSISAQDHGIREVAGLLMDRLAAMGLGTELIETPGHPTVLARWDGAPGAPTVLLYGHYDVQPPEPLELWHSPPFEPTVRDGRLYARGAGDNKGQHFAQILAVESHLAVHGRLPCNVVLLLEGEEEVGSPNLAATVRAHRERLGCDLVVTADGPMHASGAPTVTFGVRGLAAFELRARTASRDVHSGNFGGVVPNAVWSLVHLLATMKSPDGRITIEGLEALARPPSNAARAAADALPLDLPALKAQLGLSRLDEPAARPFQDRLMFHPTLTINGLHGGYGGPGTKTVLPAEATARCDIRLVDGMTPAAVLALVERHVRAVAPDVEFVPRDGMLPSSTPLDHRFAAPIAAALREAQGRDPLLIPVMGGSLPDYVWTAILGVPAFVVPYANADEANHAPNENIMLDCFHNGIRTGAALLSHLARA